jgi:hypothetical protein
VFSSPLYENAGKWAEPWVALPSAHSQVKDVVPPFGIIGQPLPNRAQERNPIPSAQPTRGMGDILPINGRFNDNGHHHLAPSTLHAEESNFGKKTCYDKNRIAMLNQAFYAVLANYDYPGTDLSHPFEITRRLCVFL